MTVEDRATKCLVEIGGTASDEWVLKVLTQALRDQIEDCANIVAGEASLCSKGDENGYVKGGYIGLHDAWLRIRALAAPTEEGKESEG